VCLQRIEKQYKRLLDDSNFCGGFHVGQKRPKVDGVPKESIKEENKIKEAKKAKESSKESTKESEDNDKVKQKLMANDLAIKFFGKTKRWEVTSATDFSALLDILQEDLGVELDREGKDVCL